MKHVLMVEQPIIKPNLLNFDITHHLSNEERSGEQVAIFTARVSYADIFEKRHTTKTLYQYIPSSREGIPIGRLEYLPAYTTYT